MRFLRSFFGLKPNDIEGRFHSYNAYQRNRETQLAMVPQTLAELRKYGVTTQSQLRLEYFFYTDTRDKAEGLAHKLADLRYEGGYDHSASNKKQFVVTGWTKQMTMDEKTVIDWTSRMCDLGYECDCEIDGWGTDPLQARDPAAGS